MKELVHVLGLEISNEIIHVEFKEGGKGNSEFVCSGESSKEV